MYCEDLAAEKEWGYILEMELDKMCVLILSRQRMPAQKQESIGPSEEPILLSYCAEHRQNAATSTSENHGGPPWAPG